MAVPANFFHSAHRGAKPAPQRFHQRWIESPSAAYEPIAHRRGEMSNRGRDSSGGHLCKRGGAILERKALGYDFTEIVTIKRFWRRAREKGDSEKSRDMRR